MTFDIPAWSGDTLRPMNKLTVHRQGLKHPAVSVFLVAAGRLLIQRRAPEKYHTPGLWANTCCTHPLWGEAPKDCALRRLDDELGISGVTLHHRGQIEYRADVGGGMIEHEVVDLFVAECTDPPSVAPNPDEVMDTRWVTPQELRDLITRAPDSFTPWMRIYLEQHADKVLPGF